MIPPKFQFKFQLLPQNKSLVFFSRKLRKQGILSEVLFWQAFKKNEFGYDIDRQYIIGNYIVDFFIPELGIAFEIDGSSHDNENSIELDRLKDSYLVNLGIEVIRIPDLYLKKAMNGVYLIFRNTILNREKKLTSALHINHDI